MKHHKLITRKPRVAQSNLEIIKDFLVTLTDQIVQWIFLVTM